MKAVITQELRELADESADVFWIAGFVTNDDNEWWVRTVFRGRRTGKIFDKALPIGMLPVLALGACFDRGWLKPDQAIGERESIQVSDLSQYEVLSSAEIPEQLYPLPAKTGVQKLFRYQTDHGEVLIPVVELLRALFIHNRTLALALMRPAGLEQLYYPDIPGSRVSAYLRFTREMPVSGLSKPFIREFAWMVFDPEARRSWDSVRRLTNGYQYVLFEPPPLKQSLWSFRGIRLGSSWLVLELYSLTGRKHPAKSIKYEHPCLVRNLWESGSRQDQGPDHSGKRTGLHGRSDTEIELELVNEDVGSASYRSPKVFRMEMKTSIFDQDIPVHRVMVPAKTGTQRSGKQPQINCNSAKPASMKIKVTAGERATHEPLPPLDFNTLISLPWEELGDLEVLEVTVRHMRDLLPSVEFHMALTPLKPSRAISINKGRARPAMVIVLRPVHSPPIVLIDVERSGVEALSLMTLRFNENPTAHQMESAIHRVLQGFVERGGHWSAEIEKELSGFCKTLRIPRILIPRDQYLKRGKYWAYLIIKKLGLINYSN